MVTRAAKTFVSSRSATRSSGIGATSGGPTGAGQVAVDTVVVADGARPSVHTTMPREAVATPTVAAMPSTSTVRVPADGALMLLT